MSETTNSTKVVLEIENASIMCDKLELAKHSDYFKVMFEGNFIERNKETVKLEGIDLNSMNTIFKLLWDSEYEVKEEDIPSVLQVSCMLQFVEIKALCIEKLVNLLSPRNCLKIWLVAEQLDIKPLYLKAKSMALMEFEVIKNTGIILDLNLRQLYNYLANTNLQCKSELDVFEACMSWWYENSEKFSESIDEEHFESFYTDTFLCLLSCLNYNNLSKSDIQEILTYPDISNSGGEIKEILNCIVDLKQGIQSKSNDNIIRKAVSFVNSKPRIYKQCPCILVSSLSDEHARKKQKLSSKNVPVIYYDMFKRKRYYSSVESSDSSIAIIYYDQQHDKLVKLINIDKNKCGNLDGFKIIGYKEFVFLVGGEFLIGKGDWNKNLWIYNTIRECWMRKTVPSLMRRHFELCVCDNLLYIVGGTGKFRILQDSMICYDITEDTLGNQVSLPCSGINTKCCCWNNKLLLINVSERCGYIFDNEHNSWHKLDISDDEQLVSHYPDRYNVFTYKDNIYIKGSDIIKMKYMEDKLIVTDCKLLRSVTYDQISTAICNNILYTVYKHTSLDEESNSSITLEKYNFDFQMQEFILEDVSEGLIETEKDPSVKFLTNIFEFHHYSLVDNEEFVNNYNFTLSV